MIVRTCISINDMFVVCDDWTTSRLQACGYYRVVKRTIDNV